MLGRVNISAFSHLYDRRAPAVGPRLEVTVAVGLFTDVFLYGSFVSLLPFMLRKRLSVP